MSSPFQHPSRRPSEAKRRTLTRVSDGMVFVLGATCYIGSDPCEVDITVGNDSVSLFKANARHALIVGGNITDLSSTNGTWVSMGREQYTRLMPAVPQHLTQGQHLCFGGDPGVGEGGENNNNNNNNPRRQQVVPNILTDLGRREVFVYNVETERDDESDACAICHNAIDDPSTLEACGHTFCAYCLSRWLCCNRSCPSCRASVGRTAAPDTVTGVRPPGRTDGR